MKKNNMTKTLLLLVIALGMNASALMAQVKIGDNPNTINESSMLEVQSTDKGFLPPRMTQEQRDAIVNPANGLIIYNTTEPCVQVNTGTPSAPFWDCIGREDVSNASTGGTGVATYGTAANCQAGLITGTMTKGSPVTNVNMLVYVKPTEAGSYELTAGPTNGVIFRGTGAFSANQIGQCVPIVLVGAGIPEGTGAFAWTLNTTPSETIHKTVEDVKITFVSVERYNGISPIYDYEHMKMGVGYNREQVPASSTIEIKVETTGATDYNFTATDESLHTGLTYSASGNFPVAGIYNVILNNNQPTIDTLVVGTMRMTLAGASNILELSPQIDFKTLPASETEIVEMTITGDYDGDENTANTGRIWMDRDLGAEEYLPLRGISLYGNSYQYGRGNDGHEIVVLAQLDNGTRVQGLYGETEVPLSSTTVTTSNQFVLDDPDTPETSWANTDPTTEWDGVAGVNNPCPAGYRLPTSKELLVFVKYMAVPDRPASGLSWRWRHTGSGGQNAIPNRRWWGYDPVSEHSAAIGAISTNSIEGTVINNIDFYCYGFPVRCIKDE